MSIHKKYEENNFAQEKEAFNSEEKENLSQAFLDSFSASDIPFKKVDSPAFKRPLDKVGIKLPCASTFRNKLKKKNTKKEEDMKYKFMGKGVILSIDSTKKKKEHHTSFFPSTTHDPFNYELLEVIVHRETSTSDLLVSQINEALEKNKSKVFDTP